MSVWSDFWTGLEGELLAEWPDIDQGYTPAGGGLHRVTAIEALSYAEFPPPFSVVQIPKTRASKEWGGAANLAYAPEVTIYRGIDLAQGSDTAASLETSLMALSDRLWGSCYNWGQVLEIDAVDVSEVNGMNQIFLKEGLALLGGALTVTFLLVKNIYGTMP